MHSPVHICKTNVETPSPHKPSGACMLLPMPEKDEDNSSDSPPVLPTCLQPYLTGFLCAFYVISVLLLRKLSTGDQYSEADAHLFLTPMCIFGTLVILVLTVPLHLPYSSFPFDLHVGLFIWMHFFCLVSYTLMWAGMVPAHTNARGRMVHPIRFITWMTTTPLTIYMSYARCELPLSRFLWTLGCTWTMCLSGLVAEYTEGWVCLGFFGLSMLTFCYLVYELDNFLWLGKARSRSFWLRFVSFCGWSVIPLAWVGGQLGFWQDSTVNMLYAIGDVLAKSVVCLMLEFRFILISKAKLENSL